MSNSLKTLSLAAMLLVSSSALATVTTANLGSVAESYSNMNQFNLSVDGVHINVSAWSDTEDMRSDRGKGTDSKIAQARDMDKWRGGWSIQNNDETSRYNYCGTKGHSADNFGTCGYKDYDFFLVSFSEAVTLTKATYSWVAGRDQQVSIVALDSSNFNGDLTGKSWKQVRNNHTLSSDYANIQNKSGYYTSNFNGNTKNTKSKFWLIGALNSVFGGKSSMEGNDGMKLSSISFTKAQAEVSEPSTIAIMLLAMMALVQVKRRKN